MKTSGRELRDLLLAWLALGLAFTFFLEGVPEVSESGAFPVEGFALAFLGVLATAGAGFLLHELAHKVVAIRFGQRAEFRADYGMLFIAIIGGLAGFLFAAPGAVHHRGRITDREHGLIALAGPMTNLGLAALFVPVYLINQDIGGLGVFINVVLAAFNMIPFGPLDGKTVFSWSKIVFAVVFLSSAALTVFLFTRGIGL